MRAATRLAAFVLLLSLLAATCVHYGAVEDGAWPYPGPEELAADYEGYVGQEILLFAEVGATEGEAATVTVYSETGEPALELRVPGLEGVRPGGVVQVYGTLGPGRIMEARNVVAVNRSPEAERYKYAASGAGALFVLAILFRYWRVDLGEFELEGR